MFQLKWLINQSDGERMLCFRFGIIGQDPTEFSYSFVARWSEWYQVAEEFVMDADYQTVKNRGQ